MKTLAPLIRCILPWLLASSALRAAVIGGGTLPDLAQAQFTHPGHLQTAQIDLLATLPQTPELNSARIVRISPGGKVLLALGSQALTVAAPGPRLLGYLWDQGNLAPVYSPAWPWIYTAPELLELGVADSGTLAFELTDLNDRNEVVGICKARDWSNRYDLIPYEESLGVLWSPGVSPQALNPGISSPVDRYAIYKDWFIWDRSFYKTEIDKLYLDQDGRCYGRATVELDLSAPDAPQAEPWSDYHYDVVRWENPGLAPANLSGNAALLNAEAISADDYSDILSLSPNGNLLLSTTRVLSGVEATSYRVLLPGKGVDLALATPSGASPSLITDSGLAIGFGDQFPSVWAGTSTPSMLSGYFAVASENGDILHPSESKLWLRRTSSEGDYYIPVRTSSTAASTTPGIARQVANGLFIGATNRLLSVPACLAVDDDRDGIIRSQADATNASELPSPGTFRFWANDDDDGNSDGVPDNVNSSTKDYETTGFFDLDGIKNTRDLEDFARLHLYMGGLQDSLKNGNLQLGLKWTNVTGTPKINLYKAYEADGGDQYLKNPAIAAEQIQNEYDNPIESIGGETTVAPGATFIFEQEVFANLSAAQPKTFFIFEGAGEGKGQLKMVILKDGVEIGEGPGVWFDLVNIKSMYERAVVTATFNESWNYAHASDVPAFSVSIAPDPKGYAFQQPADEAKESLVFVHGWKMEEDDVRSFAETMFKRLWWQGYNGRFRVFRWPTYTGDYSFSESEFMAWKCGSVLKNYIEGSVPGALLPSDYTKCVAAHSLGNVVVGSALKQGLVPDRYFAMQGAIPSGCYDTSDAVNGFANPAAASSAFNAVPAIAALRTMFSDGESGKSTPDDASPDWGYRGYLTGASAVKVVNFCNPQDFALTTGSTVGIDTNWLAWQFGYKPRDKTISGDINFEYRYIPTAPEGQRLWLYRYTDSAHDTVEAERPVADAHESMGFLARTRSLPLGADTQASGIVDTTVNLRDAYGFTENRADHSGQFKRTIQNVRPFYQRILQEME